MGPNSTLDILVSSFWPMLKAGLEVTIPLSVVSFILGLILALFTALARLSNIQPLRQVARFYVWVIRGTPLLVQLFILFYGLPNAGITLNPITAALIGFTLNVGAYNSEVIRAAILSIPKMQWEAAYSLGMTRRQALRRIILPQAVRVSIPPLSNSFIGLVKDTSLAAEVTVVDLFHVSQQIAAVNFDPLLMYCEAAFIYLMICTVLSWLQNRMEGRLEKFAS
jgi:cystine transport system permease protein